MDQASPGAAGVQVEKPALTPPIWVRLQLLFKASLQRRAGLRAAPRPSCAHKPPLLRLPVPLEFARGEWQAGEAGLP